MYYGYRYYNPELGRWVNRDPIEKYENYNSSKIFLRYFVEPHLYNLVNGNPLNYVDFLGLFAPPGYTFVAVGSVYQMCLPAPDDECTICFGSIDTNARGTGSSYTEARDNAIINANIEDCDAGAGCFDAGISVHLNFDLIEKE